MHPQELKTRLDAGEKITLVDVRQPAEWNHVHLDGAVHIPLHLLPLRKGELDPGALTVVYCHHGGRSAQAVQLLRQQGFAEVHNLDGGIDAWSCEVDPAKPRYG